MGVDRSRVRVKARTRVGECVGHGGGGMAVWGGDTVYVGAGDVGCGELVCRRRWQAHNESTRRGEDSEAGKETQTWPVNARLRGRFSSGGCKYPEHRPWWLATNQLVIPLLLLSSQPGGLRIIACGLHSLSVSPSPPYRIDSSSPRANRPICNRPNQLPPAHCFPKSPPPRVSRWIVNRVLSGSTVRSGLVTQLRPRRCPGFCFSSQFLPHLLVFPPGLFSHHSSTFPIMLRHIHTLAPPWPPIDHPACPIRNTNLNSARDRF